MEGSSEGGVNVAKSKNIQNNLEENFFPLSLSTKEEPSQEYHCGNKDNKHGGFKVQDN